MYVALIPQEGRIKYTEKKYFAAKNSIHIKWQDQKKKAVEA